MQCLKWSRFCGFWSRSWFLKPVVSSWSWSIAVPGTTWSVQFALIQWRYCYSCRPSCGNGRLSALHVCGCITVYVCMSASKTKSLCISNSADGQFIISPSHPFHLRCKGQLSRSAWVCTVLSECPLLGSEFIGLGLNWRFWSCSRPCWNFEVLCKLLSTDCKYWESHLNAVRKVHVYMTIGFVLKCELLHEMCDHWPGSAKLTARYGETLAWRGK